VNWCIDELDALKQRPETVETMEVDGWSGQGRMQRREAGRKHSECRQHASITATHGRSLARLPLNLSMQIIRRHGPSESPCDDRPTLRL